MDRVLRQCAALIVAIAFVALPAGVLATSDAQKPSPDKVIEMLKQGNERFVSGKSKHPHADAARVALAGKEDQGNYAYATVLSCSDSRVPVEIVFDAGIMDIFVIRVAGNVCNVDEIGCIEYGLAHVNTPLLVVLGHTQCGAVTAVCQAAEGHGHALERNIPPLIAGIQPAVTRAQHDHPEAKGSALVPYAIEANVWQAVEDLFMKSPATRNLVKKGAVKVVGAMYDVGTGKVSWLPEEKVASILQTVEGAPGRAINPMAEEKH
jgi:carbonic anhydrase